MYTTVPFGELRDAGPGERDVGGESDHLARDLPPAGIEGHGFQRAVWQRIDQIARRVACLDDRFGDQRCRHATPDIEREARPRVGALRPTDHEDGAVVEELLQPQARRGGDRLDRVGPDQAVEADPGLPIGPEGSVRSPCPEAGPHFAGERLGGAALQEHTGRRLGRTEERGQQPPAVGRDLRVGEIGYR
jgi:hypothetical protein